MAQLGQRQVRWVTSSIHCTGARGGRDIITTEPMTSSSHQFIYRSGDIMHSDSFFLETQMSNRVFYCRYQYYYTSEIIAAFITMNQV